MAFFNIKDTVKALKEGAISEEEFRRKTMEATGGLENLEAGLDKIPPNNNNNALKLSNIPTIKNTIKTPLK